MNLRDEMTLALGMVWLGVAIMVGLVIWAVLQ